MRMETVVDKMNQVLGSDGDLKEFCDALREKYGKKGKKRKARRKTKLV